MKTTREWRLTNRSIIKFRRYPKEGTTTMKAATSDPMQPIWRTADELAFIRGLGFHRGALSRTPTGRLNLLQGYREACTQRTDWDDLDDDEISVFLMRSIEVEQQVVDLDPPL